MSKIYVIPDINGNKLPVYDLDLYQALLEQDFKVLGLHMRDILELKLQYELRGGILEITPESIKEAFKNE